MAGQTSFDIALQKQQAGTTASPQAIANVYQAYKAGKMTPEESQQFEQDVKSGAVMLPRGAALNGQEAAGPKVLPQAVSDAYVQGKMSDKERADLEADMKAGLVKLPVQTADLIPTSPDFKPPTEQGIIAQPKEPTMGERAIGAGEAGLSTVTGATTGLAGTIAGTVEGITKSILDGTYGTQQGVDQAEATAANRGGQVTYQPRTEQGSEQAAAVGDVMQQLTPLGPLGGEMAMIGQGAKMAAPAARAASELAMQRAGQGAASVAESVKPAVTAAVDAVKAAPQKVGEKLGLTEPAAVPESASMGKSVGAASASSGVMRDATAEMLPVPMDLTKGAATRDAAQLAFEKEMTKNPTLGAPLRKRAEENNLQALQNMDALFDMTEAEAPDLSATGNKVTQALSQGYKAAKNKVNVAYRNARNSEEAGATVDPGAAVSIGEGENAINNSLTGYLNGKVTGVPSAAVTDAARKLAVKMGIAEEGPDGALVPKPTTVGQMEDFRRELSGTAKWDDKVGMREETILKKIIDAQTEPVAGPLFKAARAERAAMARKFENRGVVARLIQNVKGMDDPKVAADQVFHKSILNSSPEEITFLKRVLNTTSGDGQQAWKELQGALVRHIREEATKGLGMDSRDNPIVSPAKLNQVVKQLDKNGRLDIVLGEKRADIVRDLNDVVQYVNTVPPGTLINNSGTYGALLAAITEAGVNGSMFGVPVPALSAIRFLSRQITDAKVRKKINAALNEKPHKLVGASNEL